MAGAIRGIKGKWFGIDDGKHTPINIEKITITKGGSILIYYDLTTETIHTFHVTLDERFAGLGYFVGAAVGNQFA